MAAQLLAALGCAALLAAWLAPNHYPPWTSFHGEAAAFAALLAFALAHGLAARAIGGSRIWMLVAFLLAVIALQWAAGLIAYSGDALLSAMYAAGAGLGWWLGEAGSEVGRRPAQDPFTGLAALVVTGAALSIFIATLQWLRMEQALGIFSAERGPGMRPFGNLGQPNHLATLCVMAAVLSFWLAENGWLRRWQLLVLLAWTAFGLLMTESRSGLLGAALAGLLLWHHGPAFGVRVRRLVMGWWALLGAGYWAWPAVTEALFLQGARASHDLTQDSARLVMWRQCLRAIGEAPWFGHGWRQTILAQKEATLAVPGWLATDYAHNVLLDILIWVGIPLGTLLILLAALWTVRALRRLHGPRQVVLLAAVVPFAAHSLVEFPFAYSYFLFPVAWLLGTLSAAQRVPLVQDARPPRGIARGLLLAGTLAFAALSLAVAAEYLLAEEDYRVMRFELRQVGRTPSGYAAPDLPLLTQLDETLKLGRLVPTPNMPPRDLERLATASARQGWATLDLSYAVALGLNGRPAEASRQLALLRTVYGEDSAMQAYDMFRAMRATYPQLAAVPIP